MPNPGQTGVVVPVPAADGLLSAVSQRCPDVVRAGLPAHVSLLYPFLDAAVLDTEAVDWLDALARQRPPLRLEFTEVDREPGFVSLGSPALASLTDAVRGRWPTIPPYGGRFGANPPAHLTVAMGVTEQAADGVAALVREFLPLPVVLDELWLVAFDGDWRISQKFGFTG